MDIFYAHFAGTACLSEFLFACLEQALMHEDLNREVLKCTQYISVKKAKIPRLLNAAQRWMYESYYAAVLLMNIN